MHQFISYGMANRQHSNDVNRVLSVIEDLHVSEQYSGHFAYKINNTKIQLFVDFFLAE